MRCLRGICSHRFSISTYIDAKSTFNCLEQIRILAGMALIHVHAKSMWEDTWSLGPLAAAFPDLQTMVLSGLYLYRWSSNEQTLWAAERDRNLLMDTVALPVKRWVEITLKEVRQRGGSVVATLHLCNKCSHLLS